MPSVCRICLAGNMSLRSVTNNLLQRFYEKLTNNKLNSEDSRPRDLCSFCYQKLLKFHIFLEMAVRSEHIFSQLYESGREVTYELPEEYINLNAKQHLSVAVKWFVTTEDIATNTGSQVAIKDEPLPSTGMSEQLTTAQEKNLEFQSFPKVLKIRHIAFKEDTSDRQNNTEELHSGNIYIDQFEPDDTSITIKHEPLSRVNIKEEITTALDELVEIKPFLEQSLRSRLIFEEDDHDVGNDLGVVNKIHVAQTKPDDSKIQFNCNNCNKMFKRKSKLISHIRNCHSQFKGYSSTKKHTETTSLIEVKTIHSQKPTFGCNIRHKQFNQKSPFVSHMKINRGEKPFCCHVCEKRFCYKETLKKHMITHSGEKPYACHECDKRFYYKSCLKKHVIIHTGLKSFTCLVCGKQFYRKSNLVSHMRTHTDEKQFSCHVCEKRFTHKSTLRNHIIIHTGFNPFACHVCNKQFTDKSNLVIHMRTHTGERPFTCHECDKQFKKKSSLNSHIITHSAEKPFTCHLCHKQFYRKDNLVSHMRTHTDEKPFSCHICEKRFAHTSTLRNHIIIHTGGKPFVCNLCHKQFNQKSYLLKHTRTHSGEKPYTCHECDKRLSSKSALKKHIRIHAYSSHLYHNMW